MDSRTANQGFNVANGYHDFVLYRFLPCLIDPAVHFQFLDRSKLRYCAWYKFGCRHFQLADRSRHQLQKSDAHFEGAQRTAFHQTFRPHEPGFASVLRLAVRLRAQHTKVPALLIFHRRWTVGIEHVSLVQHGFRDLVHNGEIHYITVSSTGTMLSTTSSQLGMP